MHINKIGHHQQHDDQFQIHRPKGSGDYLLLLVFTPSQMILEQKKVIQTSPFFILYNLNTPQIYGAWKSAYMDDWIHLSFNPHDLLTLDKLHIPMDTPVSIHDAEELSDIIKAMVYEFHAAHTFSEENLSLYLHLLLNRMGEYFYTPNPSPYFSGMNKLRGTVYNEPYKEYPIDDMAAALNLSRSSFLHMYSSFFNTGFHADLIRARIEYSKELLISTGFPVYQIAEMCGYHSNIHFFRQFKSLTGLTPTQFRARKHS